MKKQLLLCATLLTAIIVVRAQKSDTALVVVHYKFTHIRDTTNSANPYTENMALYVGKTTSVYRSYDNVLSNARFKQQAKEAIANSPDGNIRLDRRMQGTPTEYYQFPNDKAMVRKEWLFNNFLIMDTLPTITWQISSDTATLNGLHCQKATTHFKGRDYTAWFCPDLPLRVGPWKLNGLPGVIIEAYDTKKDVVFKFDGVEKAVLVTDSEGSPKPDDKEHGLMGFEEENGDPAIIQLPATNVTKTTEKEFTKLQEAFHRDPTAFAQSMLDARHANNVAMGAKDPGPNKIDVKERPADVVNNPIELPENGSK